MGVKQRFIVVSDIHGFYDEFIEALKEVNFNKEIDYLVVLGDCFDRGPNPGGVMAYLMSLPRKVLVRGNHEDLLMECINRGHGLSHDFSNGTVQTILDLAPNTQPFYLACEVAYEKVKDFIGSMVNYFETKNHIFVHSWVPLNCDDDFPPYYIRNRKFSKMENWRDANDVEWEDARWCNPFALAEQGLLPGKTLVMGHWNCSEGWAIKEDRNVFGDDAKFDPFYGDGFIAIDGCVAYTHKVNCIVIEDEFMEVQ